MKAEYINHMGDDLMVVNAARVSFAKESEWKLSFECSCGTFHPDICDGSCSFGELLLSDKDQKLIKYLATHGHWTPFSHPVITMRETIPIFLARQRFKHMVGFTYNEVSRRYVDDTPEFFMPKTWRSRPEGSVKQGSGDETVWATKENALGMVTSISTLANDVNTHALKAYNRMLESGVAPEQARMILPQSMFTSYYVTGSLAAWARAYKQRTDPHVQREWEDVTKQWDEIIRPLFPVSWEALTK